MEIEKLVNKIMRCKDKQVVISQLYMYVDGLITGKIIAEAEMLKKQEDEKKYKEFELKKSA